MRDDLGKLRRLHAIVECEPEVTWHLDGLDAGYQRSHRDHTAIARRKLWPLPHPIEEWAFCVACQCWGDSIYIIRRQNRRKCTVLLIDRHLLLQTLRWLGLPQRQNHRRQSSLHEEAPAEVGRPSI